MASSISVGIVTANQIRFRFNGSYLCNGQECSADIADETVSSTTSAISWHGNLFHELIFTPKDYETASFSLFDVTIGVGFHWQRQQKQTFRGSLRLLCTEGRVCAINILPLEDYLQSVISSEMSPTASLQFLKAHAVISRSWLLAQIRKQSPESPDVPPKTSYPKYPILTHIKWYDHTDHALFDVCADDHCQRYQGITRISNPTAIQAVAETFGEVLTYEGTICDARFSKCCGGMMEEFATCWADEQKPYLVAKQDIIYDKRAAGVNEAFCNTSDPNILSQVLNDFDQETTDFYRWNVVYSGKEIDELVHQKSGIDFGHILSLTPIKRGPSGRIIELEIKGTLRTLIVGKELEIRRWLSPTHLYSSAFWVTPLADGFRLDGRGWGHGVGLCQIGAAVMGSLGYDYREILLHYYPDTTIEKK